MADQVVKAPEVQAPAEEKHPDGSPIVKGAAGTQFWKDEAEAIKIANGRVKGARRACIVKSPDGKVRYATTTHPHFLQEYLLCTELGWTVEEIGKPAKSKAPVTAANLLAAVDTLPTEAERDALRKQLAELLGGKVTKK